MIPLADTFNHKASLVLLDDAWKVAEELDGAEHQQDYSYTASKDLDCFSSGHDRGAGIAAGDPAADDDGDGLISGILNNMDMNSLTLSLLCRLLEVGYDKSVMTAPASDSANENVIIWLIL